MTITLDKTIKDALDKSLKKLENYFQTGYGEISRIEKQVKIVFSKNRKRFANDKKFQSLISIIEDLKKKGVIGSPNKLPMCDTIGRYDSFS